MGIVLTQRSRVGLEGERCIHYCVGLAGGLGGGGRDCGVICRGRRSPIGVERCVCVVGFIRVCLMW